MSSSQLTPYLSTAQKGKDKKKRSQEKILKEFLESLGIKDRTIVEILKLARKDLAKASEKAKLQLLRDVIDGVVIPSPEDFSDLEDTFGVPTSSFNGGPYSCFATQTPQGKIYYWITDYHGDRTLASKKYLAKKNVIPPVPFPIFKDRFPILVLVTFDKRGEDVGAWFVYCPNEERLRKEILRIPSSDYEKPRCHLADINVNKLLVEEGLEIGDCYFEIIGYYGSNKPSESKNVIPKRAGYYTIETGPTIGKCVGHFSSEEKAREFIENRIGKNSGSFSSDSEEEDGLIVYILAKWTLGDSPESALETIYSGVKGEWKDCFP